MLSSVAVTTIIVLALFHKSPTEKIDGKQVRTPKNVNAFKSARYKENLNWVSHSVSRMAKQTRNLQILNDTQIVLQNNADEYNQLEGQLKQFYGKVSICGLENCGNFTVLFPAKCLKRFQCRKWSSKVLNNMTKKYLSRIICGADIFVKMFRQLIHLEESGKFSRRETDREQRVGILKKLKISMSTLIKELNETGHVKPHKSEQAPQMVHKSKNDLILNEWRVIQMSLNATREYLINVEKIQKCWAPNWLFNDVE